MILGGIETGTTEIMHGIIIHIGILITIFMRGTLVFTLHIIINLITMDMQIHTEIITTAITEIEITEEELHTIVLIEETVL